MLKGKTLLRIVEFCGFIFRIDSHQIHWNALRSFVRNAFLIMYDFCCYKMLQLCLYSWKFLCIWKFNDMAYSIDYLGIYGMQGKQTEPVSYSKCSKWRPLAFPHHAATHILQEKTHACGVLKRHNFRVHVSLGSAETLVRRVGIVNHHSMAYSLSNISAKNYRNRLMWVESIVCNISVFFLGHSVFPDVSDWTELCYC